MNKILTVALCTILVGCEGLQPKRGLSHSNINAAIMSGSPCVYVRYTQTIPLDAVKHTDVTAGTSAIPINWAELDTVIVGDTINGIFETEREKLRIRGELISNGLEVLIVGYGTTNELEQLHQMLNDVGVIIGNTSLNEAIIGPAPCSE